jgi:hypothetical protein
MNEVREQIEKLLRSGSIAELKALKTYLSKQVPHPLEKEWDIDGDTILSAIRRSSDLTKRGVRGIIAEAVFETSVIPTIEGSSWENSDIEGNLSYDALFKKGKLSARVQIKLQRMESGRPKLYYPKHYDEGSLYVVEVQKTRSGKTRAKQPLQGSDASIEVTTSVSEETRPYRFGDFDILAVNMHPSSGNWKSFRYTLASWLLPRSNQALIDVLQPVAAVPNELWTDELKTCLSWFELGEEHRILTNLLHVRSSKSPLKSTNGLTGKSENAIPKIPKKKSKNPIE